MRSDERFNKVTKLSEITQIKLYYLSVYCRSTHFFTRFFTFFLHEAYGYLQE